LRPVVFLVVQVRNELEEISLVLVLIVVEQARFDLIHGIAGPTGRRLQLLCGVPHTAE
jgi:hypothetical protein